MRSVVKVGNILMIKADTLTDRWDYIDLMEAIAMQFVLTYHSTSYYFNWIEDHSVLCFLRYFLTTIFQRVSRYSFLQMDIFCSIEGFL